MGTRAAIRVPSGQERIERDESFSVIICHLAGGGGDIV